VDLTHVARKVIKRIGYDQPDFNAKTCSILTAPMGSPPDKYFIFDEYRLTDQEIEKIAVKAQATVFGFACDQTPNFMPLPIWLARRISRQLSTVRNQGVLPYLMPDGKVQVGIEYEDRKPVHMHSITVTASQRNDRDPTLKTLREDIEEKVIKPIFEDQPIKPDKKTRIFINPDGTFLGGPTYHSGLTGRKNGVDTYGEYCRHSGNALSGKDPSRIDRVGAYVARYAAKNVVAAGLASECEITLSYSLGITRPVSLHVETFGTGKLPDMEIRERVKKHFDFRLAAILRDFRLRHLPAEHPEGFYAKLAAYGHFGRMDMDLPWEKTDKAELLKAL
jgi:S-adenosylmethionine synthetase